MHSLGMQAVESSALSFRIRISFFFLLLFLQQGTLGPDGDLDHRFGAILGDLVRRSGQSMAFTEATWVTFSYLCQPCFKSLCTTLLTFIFPLAMDSGILPPGLLCTEILIKINMKMKWKFTYSKGSPKQLKPLDAWLCKHRWISKLHWLLGISFSGFPFVEKTKDASPRGRMPVTCMCATEYLCFGSADKHKLLRQSFGPGSVC